MKGLIYVIHKHHASHLHYDLRLEVDGVLKSWALPKEPPLEKGVKRLAVMVEDHELGYAKFEGIIPKGQYGAGKVEIWDEGFYIPKEVKKDRMVFELHGRKLKGDYVLVRFKSGTDIGKNQKNWLFFKK